MADVDQSVLWRKYMRELQTQVLGADVGKETTFSVASVARKADFNDKIPEVTNNSVFLMGD
jgi:hypothetical protein